MFKLIKKILESHLEILTAQLEEYKLSREKRGWYTEAGKPIEELSCLYPASHEDAAIIFEEWCKGVLTTRRPFDEQLRKYAEWTASDRCWDLWREYKRKDGVDYDM